MSIEIHNYFWSMVSLVATANSNYRQNIYEIRNMVLTSEKNGKKKKKKYSQFWQGCLHHLSLIFLNFKIIVMIVGCCRLVYQEWSPWDANPELLPYGIILFSKTRILIWVAVCILWWWIWVTDWWYNIIAAWSLLLGWECCSAVYVRIKWGCVKHCLLVVNCKLSFYSLFLFRLGPGLLPM